MGKNLQKKRLNPVTRFVITSISKPSTPIAKLARVARRFGGDLIIVGDRKSPAKFRQPGCQFLSIEDQQRLPFHVARALHKDSYARKNLGYLIAFSQGADLVFETDDDNQPEPNFFPYRDLVERRSLVSEGGWLNVYKYFTRKKIWPRGLPLDEVLASFSQTRKASKGVAECPIQQGLANGDPDVDAAYRLLFPLPFRFDHSHDIALAPGTWCPFNSQNTSWYLPALPLMYLPTFCSFRMTDIWRSFVAQRLAWEMGWTILFRGANVTQDRNIHDYMRDFSDEIPGYLNNKKFVMVLEGLSLKKGQQHLTSNLLICYAALTRAELIDRQEIKIVELWVQDCEILLKTTPDHPKVR